MYQLRDGPAFDMEIVDESAEGEKSHQDYNLHDCTIYRIQLHV